MQQSLSGELGVIVISPLRLLSLEVSLYKESLQQDTASVWEEVVMLRKMLETHSSTALTELRVTLGVVMFAHGAQKMFGWFGGKGLDAALHNLVPGKYVPVPFAFLAVCAEFFGGLGLITGLLTRVAAFGVAANMIVAVAMVEGHTGFFMNWEGQKQGEGYEYHLLVLAITYALMLRGGGSASIDGLLEERRQLRAS